MTEDGDLRSGRDSREFEFVGAGESEVGSQRFAQGRSPERRLARFSDFVLFAKSLSATAEFRVVKVC